MKVPGSFAPRRRSPSTIPDKRFQTADFWAKLVSYAAPDGQLRQECPTGVIQLSVEKSELGQRIFARAPKAKII